MHKKQKIVLGIISVVILASLCWGLWQSLQDKDPMENWDPYKPTVGDAT